MVHQDMVLKWRCCYACCRLGGVPVVGFARTAHSDAVAVQMLCYLHVSQALEHGRVKYAEAKPGKTRFEREKPHP